MGSVVRERANDGGDPTNFGLPGACPHGFHEIEHKKLLRFFGTRRT